MKQTTYFHIKTTCYFRHSSALESIMPILTTHLQEPHSRSSLPEEDRANGSPRFNILRNGFFIRSWSVFG
ncbi:hypothetical protein LguiA_023638 [Lonicera macranthoides]